MLPILLVRLLISIAHELLPQQGGSVWQQLLHQRTCCCCTSFFQTDLGGGGELVSLVIRDTTSDCTEESAQLAGSFVPFRSSLITCSQLLTTLAPMAVDGQNNRHNSSIPKAMTICASKGVCVMFWLFCGWGVTSNLGNRWEPRTMAVRMSSKVCGDVNQRRKKRLLPTASVQTHRVVAVIPASSESYRWAAAHPSTVAEEAYSCRQMWADFVYALSSTRVHSR
jgi:hypothetical protein